MRTLAIANAKGGVGKTATAHTLGVILARTRRVLLVDCDPQATLTQGAGIEPDRTLADVMGDARPGTVALGDVIASLGDTLGLVPSGLALAYSELGLVVRNGREAVLRRALAPVAEAYDLAILDTPPSLGLLTVNALTAANGVMIPTLPEISALRGVALFMRALEEIRRDLNPELETLGVVATMRDSRLRHHAEALEVMRDGGVPLLDVTIGRSVRVAEASGRSETVVSYAPGNPRAAEYDELAEVVTAWLDRDRR